MSTYQRKNGSQQSRNTPIMMPNVRAALCSARHPLAGRMDPSNLIGRLRNVYNHVCMHECFCCKSINVMERIVKNKMNENEMRERREREKDGEKNNRENREKIWY